MTTNHGPIPWPEGLLAGRDLLLTRAGDGFDALVRNTTGRGPCPDEEFAAIDLERLAARAGCDVAWRTARRFWMIDALTIDLVGELATFDGRRTRPHRGRPAAAR